MNNLFTLITIYLVAFAGFASFAWLFPVVPYYAADLGLNAMDVGIVVSIYSYVNAILILPFGIVSDRLGRRTMLISGLIISTIIPFFYPLANDMLTLCIIRAFHGLGASIFIPTALAIIGDVSAPETRGRIMGWYTASAQLGLMAGPLAGGFLLQNFGFNTAFYGCSLMPLLGLAFLLTRLKAIHQKAVPAPAIISNENSVNWLKQRGAAISLLTLVIIALGSGSVSTFTPLYVRGFDIPEAGAGIIITACYLGSAALRVPAGTLSDRFSNLPLIVSGLLLCALGIGLIPLMDKMWSFTLAALIFGTGMGFAMPASLIWLSQITPPGRHGLTMGTGSAAFQVGLAMGATAMGMIAESNGYANMYFTAAAFIASGMLLVLLIKPRPSNDSSP